MSEIVAGTTARLREQMRREAIGACIVADPVSVTYLSGYVGGDSAVPSPPSFVVVTADEALLVAPERAEVEPSGRLRHVPYEDYAITHEADATLAALDGFVRALEAVQGAGRVAAELGHLPAAAYQSLNACRGVEAVIDARSMLRALRAVKSEAEVEAIRRSVQAADRIFEAVAEQVGEGDTELDVYITCVEALTQEAGGMAALDGDFVSGERTEQVGGKPTSRRLGRGDLLIIDIYPRLGVYWADVTRTFAVGGPTQEQADRHGLLEEALAAGEAAARPGVTLRQLYQEVRAVFDRAGVGDRFPHHAGHCVGLQPFEDPAIIPGSSHVLRQGMVITLEPGLYVEGKGGMRLEDNYVVTGDGLRGLSGYPRKLTVL